MKTTKSLARLDTLAHSHAPPHAGRGMGSGVVAATGEVIWPQPDSFG